ncbi:MAG: hypothetical protein AAF211_08220, partial [Myxococcota bacterium]
RDRRATVDPRRPRYAAAGGNMVRWILLGLWGMAGCDGSPDDDTPPTDAASSSDWDRMQWDQGRWQ